MTVILGHLLHKIQSGQALNRDDREFLATLVEAKIKPRPHRPRDEWARWRQDAAAMTVIAYQYEHQCKQDAGVEEAKRVHKVGREYVFRALKAFRERPIGFRVMNVAGVERRFVSRDGREWEIEPPEAQWQAIKTPDGRWKVVPYRGGQWPEVD